MPSTISHALETYEFRRVHPADKSTEFLWPGGGIVLLCCEILPRTNGEINFRIIRGYDAANDALEIANTSLRQDHRDVGCGGGCLFALLGAVPAKLRPVLLAKVEDVALVKRIFAIPHTEY
jgi:hypothetical protein